MAQSSARLGALLVLARAGGFKGGSGMTPEGWALQAGNQKLIVVGDRILVKPENMEERTKVGLILPQSVKEKEPVQTGLVVATGPGIGVPAMNADYDEPWQESQQAQIRYMPLQAEVGDHALFLRKDGIEIKYRSENFIVVPQASVMLIIRGDSPGEPVEW